MISLWSSSHIIVKRASTLLMGLVVLCAPVSVSKAAVQAAVGQNGEVLSAWINGQNSTPLLVQMPITAQTFKGAGFETATDGLTFVEDRFNQADFLALTNAQRRQAGLSQLVLQDQLSQAARAKAIDMITKGYWEHFRPSDGKAPWDFIHEAGYTYLSAGENLARGFETPQGITGAWMNSPTHRANILSLKYTEVGFACVRVINSNGNSVLFTVQMFGRR